MKFPKDWNILTTVSNLKNVTSLMFHFPNHSGNTLKGGLVVGNLEQNGRPTEFDCRPLPPSLSGIFPGWTRSRKHENVDIQTWNWLHLRLMTKSVTSLMKFPEHRNTLMMKSVPSLRTCSKDWDKLTMKNVNSLMNFPMIPNTFTTKSVNSLMKFPKDWNILTNNLKKCD